MLSYSSRLWLFVTPWTVARLAPLSVDILQARESPWAARPSCRESSQTRDQTQISHTADGFIIWATKEAVRIAKKLLEELKKKKKVILNESIS